MSQRRVLIVEDRPGVLRLMATVLERGYVVVTAGDGATAIAVLRSERFDAILTDIRMPGATGFEVLREARKHSPSTSVVMITAYANVADAVSAIKLGAYDYVTKPLDADEIALVVARAVEHLRAPSDHGEVTLNSRSLVDTVELSIGYHEAVAEARDRASRDYLRRLMHLFRGNVTQAAIRAGMTRESLHRVLKKYEIHAAHAPHEPWNARTSAPPQPAARAFNEPLRVTRGGGE